MNKVYLTQKEFDEMLEYSCSVPTGVFIGKVWKRNTSFRTGRKPNWVQGGYIQDPNDNNMALTVWKDIIVVGPLEIDKAIAKFGERCKEA